MAKPTVNLKKRVLLPLWIARICLMTVVIIGFSLTIGLFEQIREQWSIKLGAAIAFLLFAVIVVLLDILQIIMFARDNLQPGGFLTMNALQTSFWGVVVIMDIVEVANRRQHPQALGIVVIIFLLYLTLLLHAVQAFVRQRQEAKRGHYVPAHNPVTPAAVETPYSGLPPAYQSSTAYHSPMHNGGDLGQAQPHYPIHGDTAEYYVDQPAKPAHMV